MIYSKGVKVLINFYILLEFIYIKKNGLEYKRQLEEKWVKIYQFYFQKPDIAA